MLFSECGLKAGLLRSLESIGYKEATPIQEKVMKIALTGKNIVGQSQTGTGKTAAFLLPVLNKVDTNNKKLQVLILAPTRELVVQIGDEIKNLTKFYGVTYSCLYGGASPLLQKNSLRRNPAIVVATPGRLMDFIDQRIIDIRIVEYFILDEVDRMLDMGFIRDIRKIRAQLKNVKQTYTFSATMNDDMKKIIKEYVPSSEFIKIGEEVTVDKIHHRYLAIEHDQKLYNLLKLIQTYGKQKILIFTHTKRNTKTIHQILISNGLNAGLLNGNMAQGKRQSTLNEFKEGKTQILVTTDVAARGLNMENVGLVINFDVPADVKSYIHRIGRTGRAGAIGKAIMLVSPLESSLLKDIEKTHRITVQQGEELVTFDKTGTFKHIRLDRSTDKKGGRGGSQRPQRQGERRYSKDTKSSDKKPDGKFGNKRPVNRGPRAEGTAGFSKRRPEERSSDDRSSRGGYKGKKPDGRDLKASKPRGSQFRGMGKPREYRK